VALITAVLRYRSFQASDRNSPGGNAGSGANVRNANEPTFACVCVCVCVCVRVCVDNCDVGERNTVRLEGPKGNDESTNQFVILQWVGPQYLDPPVMKL
jgi:hypothetical protein